MKRRNLKKIVEYDLFYAALTGSTLWSLFNLQTSVLTKIIFTVLLILGVSSLMITTTDDSYWDLSLLTPIERRIFKAVFTFALIGAGLGVISIKTSFLDLIGDYIQVVSAAIFLFYQLYLIILSKL